MTGVVGQQFIRLISNLILTRLLVPEYFGLMALVTSTLVLLTLMTDLGVSRSVVNHQDNQPHFFETAWTLQLLQSGVICIVAIIAAYPMSLFYGEPDLFPLLSIAGFAMLIRGFTSLGCALAEKAVKPKLNIIILISSQATSALAMLIAAYYMRSVYALAIGVLVESTTRMSLSYLFYNKHYCHFRLDKKAAKNILSFGKWILLSSALSILTGQGDALILGAFMPMEMLGKYVIASVFAGAIVLALNAISSSVLHPRYRELLDKPNGVDDIKRLRITFLSIFALVGLTLVFGGGILIGLLYDDRYQDSGWMLEMLALGKIGFCMSTTMLPLLIAKGDSFATMIANGLASIILFACLIVGYHFYGTKGLVAAYAGSPFLSHIAVLFLARRYQFNFFRVDLLFCIILFCITTSVWWFFDLGFFKANGVHL